MTREEFISKYPTPEYVIDAWADMHQNMNDSTMRAWEDACRRARAEADAAYDKQQARGVVSPPAS